MKPMTTAHIEFQV